MQQRTSDRWGVRLARVTVTAALLGATVLSAGAAADDGGGDAPSGRQRADTGGPVQQRGHDADPGHDDDAGGGDDDAGGGDDGGDGGEDRGDDHRVEADLVAARLPQSAACQGSVCNTATVGAITVVTGDLRGSMFGGGTSINDGTVAVSIGLGRFSGEIEGCGSGSFAMVTELRLPLANPGDARSTWHIVPGSGTDDLRRINGEGTAVGSITPTELRSHISGEVHC